MGIFNNKLEIIEENPFKDDKLQREEEVKNLTAMFDIVNNQMVLAINSPWGTGKTSFLKMWNQYLKCMKYNTVFFNAWENDYVEDPFIAFVDEIRESIGNEIVARCFVEKAKTLGAALMKQSPKIAATMIKGKTGFDSNEIVSSDELSKFISDKLDNYSKNKKSVNEFKKELEKIAGNEIDKKTPLIIFVDELDRCRPDYAIALLERIKHFFNVPNIVFILGIDKEALSNSVKLIYGEQTDVNGYLTRFIDLEYKLKESSREVFIKCLLEKYGFEELFIERATLRTNIDAEKIFDKFTEELTRVITGFELSLRDIEKLVVELYMILKVNVGKNIFPYPLILMCIIKKINRGLYERIKDNTISYQDTIKMLEIFKPNISRWIEHRDVSIYKAYLIWFLNDIEEVIKIKSIVEDSTEEKNYMNKDVRFNQEYKWIEEGSAYDFIKRRDEIIKKVFEKVQLYDNFSTLY